MQWVGLVDVPNEKRSRMLDAALQDAGRTTNSGRIIASL